MTRALRLGCTWQAKEVTQRRRPASRAQLPSKSQPPCCTHARPESTTPGKLVADVVYKASSQVLLLGEADFSFAAALGQGLGDCAGMTATSFESREALLARFGMPFSRRVAALEERLCGVLHSLPAADVPQRFRSASFDVVAFNFPLPWIPPPVATSGSLLEMSPRDAHAVRARETYVGLAELLVDFFRGAAHVLRAGGECHLRLTDQHISSRGLATAEGYGLSCTGRIDFFQAFDHVYKQLGYRPTAVAAGEARRGRRRAVFDVRHSSTLVFRRGHEEIPGRY